MAGGNENGNGRGGMSNASPRGGQMPPPRGPRGGGGGGGHGGAGHPAAGHGVGGSDHGGGNRGGRGGNLGGRGGGRGGHEGRGRRGSRGGNRGHGNAQSAAINPSQNAAPTTVASNPASSTAKTVPGAVNDGNIGNVGKSTSTDGLAVSTPRLTTPATSFAVPSTTATVSPLSLPATEIRETQSNPGSSIRAGLSQDPSAMTVTNPGSLPASTASNSSAITTSNAAPNPQSLVPSTPSRIFGTFGSNNRASFGTPFAANNTSSVFRSSTPVPSSFSLAPSASGAVHPLQSNAALLFPSPSTNNNAFGAFGRSATPSVPPASANTSPLSALGSNVTIFAAPTFAGPAAFRAPQFREYRESSLPLTSASTNSLGTFGSSTNAFALPPALRRPIGTIPSEAAERNDITPANQPEAQAPPTILGKRRAASKSPEPNLTQATEGAAHTNKRVKTENQTEFSTQGPSTASQVPSVSASISQELQTWGNKLKELDHDFEERDKAWIKRQELEAWREQERKKLATKREACMKVLQSARDKMENIMAEEAKLQREYLEKLEAIEKNGSGNA